MLCLIETSRALFVNQDKQDSSFLADFFRLESAGGILLFIAAMAAIVLANTPFAVIYDLLLSLELQVRVGQINLEKPLLLWINDGLMAIFFFLVGLELKREVMVGELRQPSQVLLPAVGAVGGMAVPALVYLALNGDDPVASKGWAIPAATDIAFALGVLSLLGSKVPTSIKIFLTSLAIFDDLGAIIIIALFYTANISTGALWFAAGCVVVLLILNRLNVVSKSPYILVGIIMWVALLKSGVHATLAGVLLAMFVPMGVKQKGNEAKPNNKSPLMELEHDLHSIVAFFVLPVFAFANAGIPLVGVGIDNLLHSVPLGIALGLVVGKQVGIFLLCGLVIKLGWAKLPPGMSWASLYGTAALCGIGFTMSLFIGSLAFEETGVNLLFDERLGIIVGSLISGILGYLLLAREFRKSN